MFQKTIILTLLTIFISNPFYAQEVIWGEKILINEDSRVRQNFIQLKN